MGYKSQIVDLDIKRGDIVEILYENDDNSYPKAKTGERYRVVSVRNDSITLDNTGTSYGIYVSYSQIMLYHRPINK